MLTEIARNPLLPYLVTALPGPKAAQIIARDQAVISPSYTRCYPLVMKRGEGAVVEDVDGNHFLDFALASPSVATAIRILAWSCHSKTGRRIPPHVGDRFLLREHGAIGRKARRPDSRQRPPARVLR